MDEFHASRNEMDQSITAMIEDLERYTLRPLQKESLLCAAKCCDTSGKHAEFRSCCSMCERKMQAAEETMKARLHDFQGRISRCASRCQDEATEGLAAGANDEQAAQAERKFAKCAKGCITEYQGKIPALKKDLLAAIAALTKR